MFAEVDPEKVILGIFDGHDDGGDCSDYAAKEVKELLSNPATKDADWSKRLLDTFRMVDDRLDETNIPGGSTAVVAVVTTDHIVVANG
jgi:hypothetical protein